MPKLMFGGDGKYELSTLKGQGHVTANKPVISRIYIIAHTWLLCSAQIFGGWDESIIKLLLKIHQYLCNRMSVLFSSKSMSQSPK